MNDRLHRLGVTDVEVLSNDRSLCVGFVLEGRRMAISADIADTLPTERIETLVGNAAWRHLFSNRARNVRPL